jgi:hypothetical protein
MVQGLNPPQKAELVAKGLSLSFAFLRTWVQCLRGVVPA